MTRQTGVASLFYIDHLYEMTQSQVEICLILLFHSISQNQTIQ